MPRSPIVAVLTADVIASSRYDPADRRRIDRHIREAFADAERRFPGAFHTQMAFRITAGDEFQCVLRDVPQCHRVLTYVRALTASRGLRPPLRFRASLGIGPISVTRRKNPYEEDGTAFALARQGLVELARTRVPERWTKLVTGTPEVDAAAEAVLCLADYMIERWTVPQWAAIRWVVLQQTREAISGKLNIAHQNVTKRLSAAGWAHFKVADDYLVDLLHHTSSTLRRMQRIEAPT